MKLTGMDNDTMPWILKAVDVILISITTIICAYFYPFAYWWYKQSFTGTTLDNVIYREYLEYNASENRNELPDETITMLLDAVALLLPDENEHMKPVCH